MSQKDPKVSEPAQEAGEDTAELSLDELSKVTGGTASAPHTIASPRDPASGLPTGKRLHKPFRIG